VDGTSLIPPDGYLSLALEVLDLAEATVLVGADDALEAGVGVPVVLELAAGTALDLVPDEAFAVVTGRLLDLEVTLAGVLVTATGTDFAVAVLVLGFEEEVGTAEEDFIFVVVVLGFATPLMAESGIVREVLIGLPPPGAGGVTLVVVVGATFGFIVGDVFGAGVNRVGVAAEAVLVTGVVAGGAALVVGGVLVTVGTDVTLFGRLLALDTAAAVAFAAAVGGNDQFDAGLCELSSGDLSESSDNALGKKESGEEFVSDSAAE